MLSMNNFSLRVGIDRRKRRRYDGDDDGQPTIAMKQKWVYSALRKSVYDRRPGHWQPCGNL